MSNRWGKRRLNKVTWGRSRRYPNEFFVYGFVGSGKSETVVTLAFRKSERAILDAYRRYRQWLGKLMNEVPREP